MSKKYVVCTKNERWYISTYSDIGYHYELTKNKKEAYVFDEYELRQACFIASTWDLCLLEVF